MDFGPTFSTLVCILLHATFIDVIVPVPNPATATEGSSRMAWGRVPAPSIVFTMRSLSMMLLIWVEAFFGMTPNYALNALILFASLAASDLRGLSRPQALKDCARSRRASRDAPLVFDHANSDDERSHAGSAPLLDALHLRPRYAV